LGLPGYTKDEESLRKGSVRQRFLDAINMINFGIEEGENIQG
jgi:hypothetical protein